MIGWTRANSGLAKERCSFRVASMDVEKLLLKVSAVNLQGPTLDKNRRDNLPDTAHCRYDEASSVAADWFAVDGESGLITTRSYLDCEAESNPRVIVVAEDGGDPRQTATATLSVSVTDVNDNVPLFESAFYEARLPEDKGVGECFLKVCFWPPDPFGSFQL